MNNFDCNGLFREKEASGGDNIADNNNKTKKKIKIIDDIDATLNSAKNKMLLQVFGAKKRDDDTAYKNEIYEYERRNRTQKKTPWRESRFIIL